MELLIKDLANVRDGEGKGVAIAEVNGRLQIVAWNQGGHDLTTVDLQDIIEAASGNGELAEMLARQRAERAA